MQQQGSREKEKVKSHLSRWLLLVGSLAGVEVFVPRNPIRAQTTGIRDHVGFHHPPRAIRWHMFFIHFHVGQRGLTCVPSYLTHPICHPSVIPYNYNFEIRRDINKFRVEIKHDVTPKLSTTSLPLVSVPNY